MHPRAGQSQLLSPRAAATDACAWSPSSERREALPQLEARTPQLEGSPPPQQLEKARVRQQRPSTAINREIEQCAHVKNIFNNKKKAIYEFRFLEIIGIVIEITEEMPWESLEAVCYDHSSWWLKCTFPVSLHTVV